MSFPNSVCMSLLVIQFLDHIYRYSIHEYVLNVLIMISAPALQAAVCTDISAEHAPNDEQK